MSLLMNMTLFSLFPGSERLHSIGCNAQRLTIRSVMKKRGNAMFLFFKGHRVHISMGDGAITNHH